jgi:hypothetical protein
MSHIDHTITQSDLNVILTYADTEFDSSQNPRVSNWKAIADTLRGIRQELIEPLSSALRSRACC